MTKSVPRFTYCEGNPRFDPAVAIQDRENHERAIRVLNEKNAFDEAIRVWFGVPERDGYVYHAVASVMLSQVQRAVEAGRRFGMHDWYREDDAGVAGDGIDKVGEDKGDDPKISPSSLPTQEDIRSHISIFSPGTSAPAALKSFLANAKKSSVRYRVASYLSSKRFLFSPSPSSSSSPLSFPGIAEIPKVKPPNLPTLPLNPSFDFWAWSCLNLEWCGPLPPPASSPEDTQQTIKSHHVLPVLMHHFGCAVPSHEALCLLKSLTLVPPATGSKKRGGRTVGHNKKIADLGSGNGYWTFMLRQYGVEVDAVDNGQSEWRVNWIPDTILQAATTYLASQNHDRHPDLILLLVYPVVAADGSFTRDVLAAYEGDTIAVVGTQNRNGYTGFRDKTMDEFMHEQKDWERLVQVPLPSFAGKDEALFVFRRRQLGAGAAVS